MGLLPYLPYQMMGGGGDGEKNREMERRNERRGVEGEMG